MILHPFLRAFQKFSFLICSLVINKLWANLDFFYTLRTFYHPVPYPMQYAWEKKFTKNPLNYFLLKVKQFHGDSVKNESVRAKN